jgi:hypothetical protein
MCDVVDWQVLSFVEIHSIAGEFPRRQHVQNLPNIGLSAVNQLVDHVCGDLHLLPAVMAASE